MKTTQNTMASKKYAKTSRFRETMHRLFKNKGAVVGLIIVLIFTTIALTANLWIDYEEMVIAQHAKEKFLKPSLEHLMGTDQYGRDTFYRLMYGTRSSMSVGVVAVLISLLFGVILGSVAGYYGGLVENIIMRGADIFHSMPTILLGIVIVSALGQSTLNLMLAVGLASVPSFIRITRAAVLTVRNQEFIESARAIGISEAKIIFQHILPNCLSPIIVQSTLRIGSAIVSAASLSFLGMGIRPPAPEWGSMLSAGREYIRKSSYMTLFPGLAIMLLVLAFNMLGDGLRDALDPKLKK